jgi:hypothetical protein
MRQRGAAFGTWAKAKAAAIGLAGAEWLTLLKREPHETLRELVLAVMGFYIGSGGLDADGGIPDTDLLGGIGHHRSFLTHSVIAGAGIETAIVLTYATIQTLHAYLPPDHDRLWDSVLSGSADTAEALCRGVSAGIAYHLAVDASGGFTPYKDLPFSMTMDGHRIVMEANAIAEGLDAAADNSRLRRHGLSGQMSEHRAHRHNNDEEHQ